MPTHQASIFSLRHCFLSPLTQSSINMSPRILIFGTGSIGAVYSYIFSRAISPENIFAVCRSNHAVASSEGFTINSTLFGQSLKVRPQVVRTVDEAVSKSNGKPFDYIIVTAKAIPSTPSLPEQISPAVSEASTIVLVQNGVAIEGIYSSRFPRNPLLSCVVYLPATQTSPGTISHGEIERLHIGTYPAAAPQPHKAAAESFASLLKSAGGTAFLHDDVQSERWNKLLVNGSWNPICALSQSRDVEFMHSSCEATGLVRKVMLEVASIANAAGYPDLSSSKVDHQLGRAKARSLPGVEPSMMADALARRNMEVDAIVGNALRIAEDKGVQTPLLKGIYALIKALDESFDKSKSQSSSSATTTTTTATTDGATAKGRPSTIAMAQ